MIQKQQQQTFVLKRFQIHIQPEKDPGFYLLITIPLFLKQAENNMKTDKLFVLLKIGYCGRPIK